MTKEEFIKLTVIEGGMKPSAAEGLWEDKPEGFDPTSKDVQAVLEILRVFAPSEFEVGS